MRCKLYVTVVMMCVLTDAGAVGVVGIAKIM